MKNLKVNLGESLVGNRTKNKIKLVNKEITSTEYSLRPKTKNQSRDAGLSVSQSNTLKEWKKNTYQSSSGPTGQTEQIKQIL